MIELLERIELRASLAQFSDILMLFEGASIEKERVKKLRSWGPLELWHEKWHHGKECGGKAGCMDMHVYTNRNGDSVDVKHRSRRPGLVRFIAKNGIDPEKRSPDHDSCSIGKAKNGQWYGWSHRAICGFGKGDMIYKEKFGDENTPFKKHGDVEIMTDADAKLSAKRFANSVS